MPDSAPDRYEFQRPLATAQAALTLLGDNPAAMQGLQALLRTARADLLRAAGDAPRAQALSRLLFALEKAAGLPQGVAALLRAAHRPTTRGIELLNSDDASELVARLDALLDAAPPADGPAPTAEAADGDIADPAATVERVLRSLQAARPRFSLQAAAQMDAALAIYDRALAEAQTPAERLAATRRFLNAVRANDEVYPLVSAAYVQRDVPAAKSADDDMNAAWADQTRQVILLTSLHPDGILSASITTAIDGADVTGDHNVITAPVIYHSDVRFAHTVSIFDEMLPLWVRLAVEAEPASIVDAPVVIEFGAPQPEQVVVTCHAEGFLLDSRDTADSSRTILVYPGQTSQWAVFLLTPDAAAGPGERAISLDFLHRGRPAGTAHFTVEVRDRPPVERGSAGARIPRQAKEGDFGELLRFARAGAPAPDFILRIALDQSERRLGYTLHSPAGKLGYIHRALGWCKLSENPRAILQKTLDGLSQLSRQGSTRLNAAERSDRSENIRTIGWYLYETLITEPLRQALAAMQQLNAQAGPLSLLVLSDEPWIPWELLLPEDQDNDGSFLCAQFRMTRWLAGPGLPDPLLVQRVDVIAPKSNLTAVETEKRYFSEQRPRGVQFDGRWLAKVADVTAALRRGDAQWLHFACHGDFDTTNADDASLKLVGGLLTPVQLSGPMRAGIARSRPLVMLNACNSGEVGVALSGIGGWAGHFVRSGATAFLGSLWEVNDALAAQFAVAFYSELFGGQPLGEALRRARRHIRDLDPANPTWLAYTLYGDPNGTVSSGQ